jgi:hypothetical protein
VIINLPVGKVRYEIKQENQYNYGNIIPVLIFLKEKSWNKEKVICIKDQTIYCHETVIRQQEITSHAEPSCRIYR